MDGKAEGQGLLVEVLDLIAHLQPLDRQGEGQGQAALPGEGVVDLLAGLEVHIGDGLGRGVVRRGGLIAEGLVLHQAVQELGLAVLVLGILHALEGELAVGHAVGRGEEHRGAKAQGLGVIPG